MLFAVMTLAACDEGRKTEAEPDQTGQRVATDEYDGEPQKATACDIDIMCCQYGIYIVPTDNYGNSVELSYEEIKLVGDNGGGSDPFDIPPYYDNHWGFIQYNDSHKMQAEKSGSIFLPTLLPEPEEFWTNMPIFTSMNVRFSPEKAIKDIKVEYRFYNWRLASWSGGPSIDDPLYDPDKAAEWGERRQYTLVMQRIWIDGIRMWQRDLLNYYPADSCNEKYDPDGIPQLIVKVE